MPSSCPSRTKLWVLFALFHACGCAQLQPSNHRNWSPDQAVLPTAEFRDELVEVRNIRHCDYRTEQDYEVRHYDKTFDLREISSVDYIVVPFPEMPNLAHTMLSFGFVDRDYLAVSVEIRKEIGESYNPLLGAIGQYEIMYVVSDERDVIQLRTNHRLNDVYVYPLRLDPAQARALFVDVMHRANRLAVQPEFYNTLTNNCTTNIRDHLNRVLPEPIPYTHRVLLSGHFDHLAYDLGLIQSDTTFPRTKYTARVNEQAYRYRDAEDFSQRIRR